MPKKKTDFRKLGYQKGFKAIQSLGEPLRRRLGIIWFNVEEVMNYLNEFGEVFTLRDHWKIEGIALLMSSLVGKPYYKGKVNITYICIIDRDLEASKKTLEKYVSKSGFKTWQDWIKKAEDLGLNGRWLYLYHVERIPEIIEES
jgi:hypothetical protein